MAGFLSDAEVGFGAAPKLLSDADVGFAISGTPPAAMTGNPAAGNGSAPEWSMSGAEFTPEANVPADRPSGQSQVMADVNAAGQGLVHGTGSLIAGAGRIAQAGTGPSAERVLAAFDLVDEGKKREAYQKLTDSERQAVGAYRGARPEDRMAQRDALRQTIDDYGKPNMATRAGMAIEGAAPQIFPVAPENEGTQTGVGRLIGGVGPALAAGSMGGPAGILASLATIGSQAYDAIFQEATAKGASREDADNAAGKAALAQAATLAVPVGRLLQRVPMPARDGLMATLVNLGRHGIEFGSANALGTFANNYVAQQTYEPGRSLTQGTGDAALEGAIAGLLIPMAGGIVRSARTYASRDLSDAARRIMNEDSIRGAITTAVEAVQPPDRASTYGPAPDFIPPQVDPPILSRIRRLIEEDSRIAANKPDLIPPRAQAATPEGVPIPGTAEPVRQPSIPTTWGELFTPGPREVPGKAREPGVPGDAAPLPQSIKAVEDGAGKSLAVRPEAETTAPPATERPVLSVAPQTSAAAKQIARAWYEKAERAGSELPPEFSDRFVDAAESLAPQTKVGQAIAGDTEVTKIINRIQEIRGEPISLQGAQEIYEHLGDAISKEYGLQGLSKDGHNLLQLQNKFWDMIQNARPEDIRGASHENDRRGAHHIPRGVDGQSGDFDQIRRSRLAELQAGPGV